MENFITLNLLDGDAFTGCYASVLRRCKQRRIQIEPWNALCGRRNGKLEDFIIQKYSRRNDLWTRLKPAVFKKAMQQS